MKSMIKTRFIYFTFFALSLHLASCNNPDPAPVNPAHIKVESLKFSPAELTLKLNESRSLSVVVLPNNATNKEVTWNSNDPDIVNVDQNGKILALKEGRASITATSVDSPSISASVAISVEAKPVVDQNYIRISCTGQVGQSIIIFVIADKDYPKAVWIDLNDNGIMDYGEEIAKSDFQKELFYKIRSNSFNIYGDIKSFGSVGWQVYLTSLDVSHSPYLESLSCYYNQLEEIDLSKNLLLKDLEINQNKLSALDLSNNRQLDYISCGENALRTLDISNNKDLTLLFCGENKLKALDLTNNKELYRLHCSGNPLQELNLSENGKLEILQCNKAALKELDISNNLLLRSLSVFSNELDALDVSKAENLTNLDCKENGIEVLDVSQNLKLELLDCSYNSIKTLDIRNMDLLTILGASDNALEDIAIGNNEKLWSVMLQNNRIASDAMSNIVENLLDRTGGNNGLININDNPSYPTEGEQQVLQNKNWTL